LSLVPVTWPVSDVDDIETSCRSMSDVSGRYPLHIDNHAAAAPEFVRKRVHGG
jgi:hypothetical protein